MGQMFNPTVPSGTSTQGKTDLKRQFNHSNVIGETVVAGDWGW